MDHMDHSDPARANVNRNNNTGDRAKPNVPSKPQHLTGLKNSSGPIPLSKGLVTPKGWSRQPRFSFGQTDQKKTDSDVTDRSSSSVSSPRWRPVPKVMQKQRSVQESNGTSKSRRQEEAKLENRIKDIAESGGNAKGSAELGIVRHLPSLE